MPRLFTKKIVWLFEEHPAPPNRVLFTPPARLFSLFELILGLALEGTAWGLFHSQFAKEAHPVLFEWVFPGILIYSLAGFGLLLLGLAICQIWTICRLDFDLDKEHVSYLRRSPFRQSVQTWFFDEIQSIKVTIESGSESSDPANYRLALELRGAPPISLGSAHESDAMRLAQRISQMTRTRLEMIDVRK